MYLQEKGRTKINGIVGQMNPFSGERFLRSEWGYVPFSYICICDKTYTNYKVINELFSVLSFLQYSYDDRATVYLKIPRKPCNAVILDFRDGIPDLETFIRSNKDEQ